MSESALSPRELGESPPPRPARPKLPARGASSGNVNGSPTRPLGKPSGLANSAIGTPKRPIGKPAPRFGSSSHLPSATSATTPIAPAVADTDTDCPPAPPLPPAPKFAKRSPSALNKLGSLDKPIGKPPPRFGNVPSASPGIHAPRGVPKGTPKRKPVPKFRAGRGGPKSGPLSPVRKQGPPHRGRTPPMSAPPSSPHPTSTTTPSTSPPHPMISPRPPGPETGAATTEEGGSAIGYRPKPPPIPTRSIREAGRGRGGRDRSDRLGSSSVPNMCAVSHLPSTSDPSIPLSPSSISSSSLPPSSSSTPLKSPRSATTGAIVSPRVHQVSRTTSAFGTVGRRFAQQQREVPPEIQTKAVEMVKALTLVALEEGSTVNVVETTVQQKGRPVTQVVERYMRISHSHRELEFGELRLDNTRTPPEYVCTVLELIHIASIASVEQGWHQVGPAHKKGSTKDKKKGGQSAAMVDTRFVFTLKMHEDSIPGVGLVQAAGLVSRGQVQLAAADPQTFEMWMDGLRALIGGAEQMDSQDTKAEIAQLIGIELECEGIMNAIAQSVAATLPPPPENFNFV